MTAAGPSPRDEAIAWAVRAHEESFDDWEALADWLAADPLHAELYDDATVAAEEGRIVSANPASVPVSTLGPPPTHPRGGYWLPTALAASLVMAIGGGWLLHRSPRPDPFQIATRAGEIREVRVGDALRIAMNGATRLTLDHRDRRVARLEEGEALFTVAHDTGHPFRLQAGEVTVTDVGTVFNVERAGNATLVSVAEGAVRVAAAGGSADAEAGQIITADVGHATLARADRDPIQVGGWRQGRIDFDGIPIAQLADRMRRATGLEMVVAPALRDHRVTGSVAVGRDRVAALRQLADLLNISIDRQGEAWVWSGRTGAGPS